MQTLQGLQLQALPQGLAAPQEFYAYHQGNRQKEVSQKEVESLTNPLSPEVEVEIDPPFLATSMAIGEAMITTLIGDREVDLEIITEVEEDRNLTKVQLPRNPK